MTKSTVLFINLDVNTFSLFKMEYTLQGPLLLNNMNFFNGLQALSLKFLSFTQYPFV